MVPKGIFSILDRPAIKPVFALPFHPLQVKDSFSLLYAEKNRIPIILFCGLYVFLFLLIFSPHNMSSWYEGESPGPVFVLLLFSICGMVALVISRAILAVVSKDQNLANWQYFAWFLGEILLAAAIVTLGNVLLHRYLMLSWQEYADTLKYAFLLLVQPYAIGLLWFYIREKGQEMDKLEQAIQALPKKPGMLQIKDDQDKPVLNIDPENLLLVKSEDNYVQLYYLTGKEVKKELVRNSIKKLEPQLSKFGFERIHRSYIVNCSKIVLFKKNSRGYHISLAGLDTMVIPVSASYLPGILNIVQETP